MSDIIIHGMEMPKYGCSHCFLRTGNYCSRIDKDESVVEYAIKSERHPDCPLGELPPHGRLIEADALKKKHHWTDDFYETEYVEVEDIDAAPTIIPASDEVQ